MSNASTRCKGGTDRTEDLNWQIESKLFHLACHERYTQLNAICKRILDSVKYSHTSIRIRNHFSHWACEFDSSSLKRKGGQSLNSILIST